MKHVLIGLVAFALAVPAVAEEDEKKPKKVGEVQGHALDEIFEKAKAPKDVLAALANDATFKKAAEEAMKTKEEVQKKVNKGGYIGPSPHRAARIKFLEVLLEGAKAER